MGRNHILNPIVLTPAQVEFLTVSIEGFTRREWSVVLAGQAGSQRRFLRIRKKKSDEARSYILVIWDSRDEDWPRFLGLINELGSHTSFLPRVFANDARHGLILEEDLGPTTLKRYCDDDPDNVLKFEKIYKQVIDALCKWQSIQPHLSKVISARVMDLDTFLWETAYFSRHCVTDFCGCEHLLTKDWDRERAQLAVEAASLPRGCMHRDFQSENVMIYKGQIRFVDFQGARLGPPEYDTASLLFDPYMERLDQSLSQKLFTYYRERSPASGISDHTFNICAAQRLMQALGAYGNLSIHKGKNWYRKYIPLALGRLKNVLVNLPEFSHMNVIVDSCIETCSTMQNKL
jgi:N-acetylmuramate 1-kinase